MSNTDKNLKATCENCEHTFVVANKSTWGQDTFCPNCGNIIRFQLSEVFDNENLAKNVQQDDKKTEILGEWKKSYVSVGHMEIYNLSCLVLMIPFIGYYLLGSVGLWGGIIIGIIGLGRIVYLLSSP